MGLKNNFFGKKHSLDTRIDISKSQGGDGIIKICKNCNREIGIIKPSRRSKGRGIFCSKSCMYEMRNLPKGSNHHNWKGENVSYRGLHQWIRRLLGQPLSCFKCGKIKTEPRSIHWANLSGEYQRVINDWVSLCVKCHSKFDHARL